MNEFFIRAKHWQIFSIFTPYVIVFLVSFIYMGASTPSGLSVFYAVTSSIAMLWFVSWFLSIAHFLNDLLPTEIRRRKYFFEIACLYALIYVPINLFFLNEKPSLGSIPDWLSFLYLFCMLYAIYSVSRCFVLIEYGQSSPWYRYMGIFLLLIFYPVGVWVVQPRINRQFVERRQKSVGITV
jgi:hypothetical protein